MAPGLTLEFDQVLKLVVKQVAAAPPCVMWKDRQQK
jgi:hypothetical protein